MFPITHSMGPQAYRIDLWKLLLGTVFCKCWEIILLSQVKQYLINAFVWKGSISRACVDIARKADCCQTCTTATQGFIAHLLLSIRVMNEFSLGFGYI